MALVLQLLSLLLSRTRGDPGASLDGRPGDRLNLSCIGVAYPIRWAWAPSFPACQGLPKGRRPILWASSSGTPAVPPLQRFSGRLRSLEPGIQRLELLLSAGDSGTFFCKGRHESESRTVLRVLGDREACRVPASTHGSGYPQVLFSLMGVGLMLGLGVLGVVYWRRRRSSPPPIRPLPVFVGHLVPHPPHSSSGDGRAPEAPRGGTQDPRGPGPGAEPALCGSGPRGPRKAQAAICSGPC
uniref:megakaryocyte and platelet inhibitory receptor G6b isoform X6 n=1 Tax=Jaculus jaculus TaxID=51337 RepID=UPI0003334BB3|nr:megakaryocyte and platelet inhibitory receptor G6b isoform X6 [Jaculus jaculus]